MWCRQAFLTYLGSQIDRLIDNITNTGSLKEKPRRVVRWRAVVQYSNSMVWCCVVISELVPGVSGRAPGRPEHPGWCDG